MQYLLLHVDTYYTWHASGRNSHIWWGKVQQVKFKRFQESEESLLSGVQEERVGPAVAIAAVTAITAITATIRSG